MKLLDQIIQTQNGDARTENGAVTNHSSLSAHLDFFSKSGALRNQKEQAWSLFSSAFATDPLKAMKLLFYCRDVRGGQGERQVFRDILTELVKVDRDAVLKNLNLIPVYGRWDDVLCLFDTDLKDEAISLFAENLRADLLSEDTTSICAKWAPSINTSSKTSRERAKLIARKMNLTDRDYRKSLSRLRKRIDVIERRMSAGDWTGINYQHVPSVANIKYRGAFLRNDEDRRREYLQALSKGEAKVNTSTLFPYDISKRVRQTSAIDQTLEEAWKNLPNYLEGNEHNGICVCDTSASMTRRRGPTEPLDVALSLSIYIAERNVGKFKDYFLTFSNRPRLQKLQGVTLRDRLNNLQAAEWGMNTDLQATFDLLLDHAVQINAPQKDMPEVVYVISDMQFDSNYVEKPDFRIIKEKYAAAGYECPKLVFWNVYAVASSQPVTVRDMNTALVSGCSPTIFKQILSGGSPLEVMDAVIEGERYSLVTI